VIIDSQIHIWGPDTPERPWRPGGVATGHLDSSPTVAGLLQVMDGAGVDRSVIVPPSWEGDRNDLALAAAASHPERFAVMGRFPLHTPAECAQLAAWRRRPGMLGVRLTLHVNPWRQWFAQGALDWFWEAADRADVPVMVYAPGLLGQVDTVAERHPRLRLIMDHLALQVGRTGAAAFASIDELLALAKHPNVAVKASALPCHSADSYPFADLHQHIRRVFDAFGPRRLFWGSDYTRLPCSYQQAVDLFTEALPFLSAQDKEWVMGRAISAWLGW
jgi:predicted TIM-barrel fold metal-dependent hydrolase